MATSMTAMTKQSHPRSESAHHHVTSTLKTKQATKPNDPLTLITIQILLPLSLSLHFSLFFSLQTCYADSKPHPSTPPLLLCSPLLSPPLLSPPLLLCSPL